MTTREYSPGEPLQGDLEVDVAPAIGYAGDKNVVYSLGTVGHGVSMTQLNG